MAPRSGIPIPPNHGLLFPTSALRNVQEASFSSGLWLFSCAHQKQQTLRTIVLLFTASPRKCAWGSRISPAAPPASLSPSVSLLRVRVSALWDHRPSWNPVCAMPLAFDDSLTIICYNETDQPDHIGRIYMGHSSIIISLAVEQ
jgi:hypothetical protein